MKSEVRDVVVAQRETRMMNETGIEAVDQDLV
jgi:hypothetical protein